jgi:hypothetical protein
MDFQLMDNLNMTASLEYLTVEIPFLRLTQT